VSENKNIIVSKQVTKASRQTIKLQVWMKLHDIYVLAVVLYY